MQGNNVNYSFDHSTIEFMASKLEKINQVRKEMNQEPLTALPNEAPDPATTSPAPAATAPAVTETNPAAVTSTTAAPAPTPTPTPESKIIIEKPKAAELTDDELFELIKSRKGITAKSWDDLKPAAPVVDKEKEAQERENKVLAFGLEKGIFNTKDYEKYVHAVSDKENLVYQQYVKEQQKADPSLTPEEIELEFNEKYGRTAEPNTRKYIRGQKEILLLADEYINSHPTFKKIFEADSLYSKHEAQESARIQSEAKLSTDGPKFQADVESIFSTGFDTVTFKNPNNEADVYTIPLPKEAVEKVKSLFSDKNFSSNKIQNGWTKEDLQQTAIAAVQNAAQPYIIMSVAEQYHLRHVAGTKGIPVPVGGPQAQQVNQSTKQLSPNMQKAKAEIEERNKVPVPSAS